MSEFDEILQRAAESGAVPGAAATIVDRGGVIWAGAAGERVLGSGEPMTIDTVGTLFSMTKAITSTAAMQLVERGELDLDAPAGDLVPYLAEVQVLDGFDDGGNPSTRPPATPITLRHLLTHTSGFVYEMWNRDDVAWRKLTGIPSVATEKSASLAALLAFDPGTKWEYGIGTDWVGKLVEAASGMTLGEYLAANVTGPLGMTDTAFERTDSMAERAMAMHARLPDGSLKVIQPSTPPPPPDFHSGGGGLSGTAPDYARFVRMILNGGELDGQRILRPETVDEMTRNQLGDLRVRPLPTVSTRVSHDADFFPGQSKSWSFMAMINEEPVHTGRPAGGVMWAGLANLYYWIDRENGVGGVFLTQVLPFGDPPVLDTFYSLERETYRRLGDRVTS